MRSGRFDYDQRGLLDRGHVRFFTRRSFERMLDDCGVEIVMRTVVGSPVDDVLERGSAVRRAGRLVRAAAAIDRAAAHVWPTMFGYQFLYVLRPTAVRRRRRLRRPDRASPTRVRAGNYAGVVWGLGDSTLTAVVAEAPRDHRRRCTLATTDRLTVACVAGAAVGFVPFLLVLWDFGVGRYGG